MRCLLNITNDHLDWHGNMKNYKIQNLKFLNFKTENQYSLINKKFKKNFKKKFF